MNKIGLFGHTDIDQKIILSSDYDGIIKLLTADPSSRNLIYRLLPQIIKNNNIGLNKDSWIINSDFLYDLLKLGEVEIIKRIWQIYVDEQYVDEQYEELGTVVLQENYYDQVMIENYLKSAPMNYDWNRFLDNYLKTVNVEGTALAIAVDIEMINKIFLAAINVKNDFIVNEIKVYWVNEDFNILLEELLKLKNLINNTKNICYFI